jgi:hypothetical protein
MGEGRGGGPCEGPSPDRPQAKSGRSPRRMATTAPPSWGNGVVVVVVVVVVVGLVLVFGGVGGLGAVWSSAPSAPSFPPPPPRGVCQI